MPICDHDLHGLTTSRRALLASGSALGALALAGMPGRAGAAAGRPQVTPAAAPANRAPLAAQPFQLLPTGSVKPAGWLRRQLEIQAAGMGGRLDEFWPDLGPDSGWLGGKGESWERGPYFLDGLVPLAWLLDSAPLKAKAQRWVDWTLDHPWDNGMIGPKSNDDWWPRMVMVKVLTQYHDLTGDPRVIPVLTNYFAHQLSALPARPIASWGRFRWQDQMVAMVWLYNRTGDTRIVDLAKLLKSQGWDWRAEFADFPFTEKVTPAQLDLGAARAGDANGLKDKALSAHGVNNAMGIKASPVWSLFSGDEGDRQAVHHQLAELDRYHGMPIGIFSADEHFAGRSPSQGVELCAVVETLFSLQHALAITGAAALGDRIERIAYNALPATFTDDMWSHQYDQQPNQIRSASQPGPWTTNGNDSNVFGLEPNFGCCTANFHQGWPKLAASLWMASAGGGLAAAIYGPSTVDTVVRGVRVALEEKTDYPFRDTVAITLSPAAPVAFPLSLRVPAWSKGLAVSINGQPVDAPVTDGFATVERTWRAGDRVEVAIRNATVAVPGPDGALTVEHGPLLFALPIGTKWTKVAQRGLSADWRATPTTPWNYGIAPDAVLTRVERAISPVPFTVKSPPVAVTVAVRRVPGWTQRTGNALPPPTDARGEGKVEVVTLVPYAAAKLRIAAFPALTT